MNRRIVFYLLFIFFGYSNASAQTGDRYMDSLYADAAKSFTNNDYSKYVDNSLKALSYAENSGNCKLILVAHYKLASAYYYVKLRIKTYEHLRIALKKSESCDASGIQATVYRLLGSMYCEDLKTDSALIYLKQAEKNLYNSKNWKELSMLSSIIGETYLESNYPVQEAEKYINQAVNYGKLSNDKNTLGFALIKLGRFKTFQKKFAEAEDCFSESKKLYREANLSEGEIYALNELALSKSKSINNLEIYDLMKRAEKIHDSIFKTETAKQTAQYKTLYETEKKESELQFKSLELEKQKQKNLYIISTSVVTFLIILILFLFIYIRYKAKQKITIIETKERERQRIARELHDNIGANMSFIISKLDIIEMKNSNSEIQEIKEVANEVIGNLRETLWALNNQDITNVDLYDKLKVYIKKRLMIESKLSESLGNEYLLSNEVVLSVYRCCQEIINNINKHSKASMVNIHFFSNNYTKIHIEFIDNGVGFNNIEKEDSYGLRNIKNRLIEIGAKLELNSKSGEGTTIRIIYN